MTGDRPRCFVALTPDPGSRDVLAGLPVANGARRTPRAQLHLTLAFLGPVERAGTERLAQRLPQLAAYDAMPALDVTRIARWPSTAHARLVVAELAQPVEVMAMSARLTEVLRGLGLPPDSRAFRPHVTLARLPRDADPLAVEPEGATPAVALRFDTLTLYESILSHLGAEHRVLASVPLPG